MNALCKELQIFMMRAADSNFVQCIMNTQEYDHLVAFHSMREIGGVSTIHILRGKMKMPTYRNRRVPVIINQ